MKFRYKLRNYILVGTMAFVVAAMPACSTQNDTRNSEPCRILKLFNVKLAEADQDSKLQINEEVYDDSYIVLNLDSLAPADGNGKISAENVSKFKSKINVNSMNENFYSFLDTIQQNMIETYTVCEVSAMLEDDLELDKKVLYALEDILLNVMRASIYGNKEVALQEYAKLSSFCIEGKSIEIDGKEYSRLNLGYGSRAVANTYAETAAYYVRTYLADDEIVLADIKLNDEDNKAQITTKLSILANQLEEKSKIDIEKAFSAKYDEIIEALDGKLNLSSDTIKNLVNMVNLGYLTSDDVSTKDMRRTLETYNSGSVDDMVTAIQAICEYNRRNPNTMIPFSMFMIDEFKATKQGTIDATALNFTQFNSIKLEGSLDYAINGSEPRNNPYYANLFKYATKDDFEHVDEDIRWQDISDGVNFVNFITIYDTFYKLPVEIKGLDSLKEVLDENIDTVVKKNELAITGECATKEKVIIKK